MKKGIQSELEPALLTKTLIKLDLYILATLPLQMTTNTEMMESVNHSIAIAPLFTSYTNNIVHLDGNLGSPDLQKPG